MAMPRLKTAVTVHFVDGKAFQVNVDSHQEGVNVLWTIEAGKPFVGWPDSPVPIFINPAHVIYATVSEV